MKRILSINVRWEQDETADLDHLETTAESHYGENGANWSHVPVAELLRVEQEHGSVWGACVEYARQDSERLAAYNRGDWHMQGCWAVAKVIVDGTCQTIRSAGLWGIESDSDDGYRREVEEEERENLLGILESLGFDVREEKAA
jgi:hypothetical protein